LSAELTKTHSFRLCLLAILLTGHGKYIERSSRPTYFTVWRKLQGNKPRVAAKIYNRLILNRIRPTIGRPSTRLTETLCWSSLRCARQNYQKT